MPKPKAAILTTRLGHWSITLAMKEALGRAGFSVETTIRDGIINELYKVVYRSAPKHNEQVYRLAAENKALRNWLKEALVLKNKPIIKKLKDDSPELVISNYYEFTPILEDIAEKCSCPVINYMANPATLVEEMELSKSAHNIVFDKKSVRSSKKDKYKITPLGWLVQDKFEQEYDQDQTKKELNLQDKPTALFVSGSLGSPADLEILEQLLAKDLKLQILYACGNNKTLLKKVNKLGKDAGSDSDNCSVQAFGFTKDIHLYMRAANLVVGKAGPNTIFETAATQTPFFASHHIPGQEDGNLEIIKRYRIGWVEEKPSKAVEKISNLVVNPKKINRLSPPLKKMAEYNKKAKRKFAEIAKGMAEEASKNS